MSLKESGNRLIPFAAAGLGIFQGLVWTILAILGIVSRFLVIDQISWITHSEKLSNTLTAIMQNDASDGPLTGVGLFAVTIVYLVMSVLWVILSSILFICTRAQRHDYLNGVRVAWGVLTLVICIYDVIVTGMLGANYKEYLDLYNSTHASGVLYVLIGYGTLFSLAARGYVLWIINLVASILMLRGELNQKTKANTDIYDSSTIDAFDEPRTPYPGHNNPAYGWENEQPKFDARPSSGNHDYPGGNNSRPQADRVAGLGKQGPKSYPQNILPAEQPNNYRYPTPHIPQPDYYPPQQSNPAMKRFPPPPPNPKFNRNERY
uniref:Uncharacterized protein n=1 Tax=Photinus pyralis TaxID=7054 RepID=A0A1Y1M4B2_PHOPY